MKSNAPWSVKGIDRDARETAKEAARREGMTVGEWLNQMIFSHGEGGAEAGAQTGALADSEVEGLRLRDIVTAIEHLRNRAVEAESKQARAMTELTRTMGGFVERVQRLERVKPAEGSYQDVAIRLEKLERAGGDRQRIDALKALEKAVAQVAVQFNNAHRATLTRLDSAEAQLQEFAERIDRVGANFGDGSGEPAELGSLKGAIDSLAERIARAERIAGEAASLKTAAAGSTDPEFVERTGARLRVLGDEIKRGGDQIRALENTIAKLSGQIEAAEKRSSEGVQKVAETIADVRTQLKAEAVAGGETPDVEAILSSARRETDGRLDALQRSLEEMSARFEALRHEPAAQAAPMPPEVQAVVVVAAPAAAATDEIDDVIDEIEEAVAALEAEDDPFAFGDDDDAAPETDDDAAADFSFQLDEEAGDDNGDITVHGDDEEEDENASNARSLLAEVRSALSGEGVSKPRPSSAPEEDDIESIIAGFDNDAPAFETAADEDEDEQAANTASLASGVALGARHPDKDAAETPAPSINKVDMVRAARQRAREAAAREDEDSRPRRGELTAKQRAILAARARQKRAAEAGLAAPEKPTLRAQASPETVEPQTTADDEDEAPEGGRFSKFAAVLSSARSRLGRNKSEKTAKNAKPKAEDATHVPGHEEQSKRNNDRAALETLQSTASARPVTLALAVAIILAIAALVFLMKDFIFKPEGADPRTSQSLTLTPAMGETASSSGAATAVPDAPAIDPQALYRESIAALNAAEDETAARAAIRTLQDAAALGFPPAQLQLGELYKTGQGVEQDLGQARVWFRRAANGGNVLAMHRIGVMTARGDGGAADPQEAIGWFERAANFGLVDSQYNLGAIYHPSGDAAATSVQDAGRAYYWYSLAALNGDTAAGELAAGVGAALSSAQRGDIDGEVAAWKAQPANAEANATAS